MKGIRWKQIPVTIHKPQTMGHRQSQVGPSTILAADVSEAIFLTAHPWHIENLTPSDEASGNFRCSAR